MKHLNYFIVLFLFCISLSTSAQLRYKDGLFYNGVDRKPYTGTHIVLNPYTQDTAGICEVKYGKIELFQMDNLRDYKGSYITIDSVDGVQNWIRSFFTTCHNRDKKILLFQWSHFMGDTLVIYSSNEYSEFNKIDVIGMEGEVYYSTESDNGKFRIKTSQFMNRDPFALVRLTNTKTKEVSETVTLMLEYLMLKKFDEDMSYLETTVDLDTLYKSATHFLEESCMYKWYDTCEKIYKAADDKQTASYLIWSSYFGLITENKNLSFPCMSLY